MKKMHALPILLVLVLGPGALAQDDPDGGRPENYGSNSLPAGEAETEAGEATTGNEGADPRRGESHPLAQDSNHAVDGKPREFAEVDKDGDGLLSIEEAREALPEHLEVTDLNGDGLLNRDEAVSALPELSFSGGSPDEPVDRDDYETIRTSLSGGEGDSIERGGDSN